MEVVKDIEFLPDSKNREFDPQGRETSAKCIIGSE